MFVNLVHVKEAVHCTTNESKSGTEHNMMKTVFAYALEYDLFVRELVMQWQEDGTLLVLYILDSLTEQNGVYV